MVPLRLSLAIFLLIGLAEQASAQTLQNIAESKRDCAVCHLEWSTDFDKPGTVLLMDKPTVSMASREQFCLGCHDGSVRDSRKKVWQEQSHKTGIKPPATMQIPAGLPLEDGKLGLPDLPHRAQSTRFGRSFQHLLPARRERSKPAMPKLPRGPRIAIG
jgi:hypothetical protein